MAKFLTMSLQNGSDPLDPKACIATVLAEVDDADLALSFEQFIERYLRPAFEQLKREQDYLLELLPALPDPE